ncbi:MAG: KpsF/GutQ family sugar-phosphate isomerase [Actinobacteria bacterium]|nr:KpsF/GutQ family sugar-phosphate isomerase [Actinomycetota bacterium]
MKSSFKKEEIISYAKGVLNNEVSGLNKLSSHIDDNFAKAIDVLLGCKGKVIIMGLGKSGHVGKKIAASMASTGTPAFFVHGDETLHGDLGMIEKKDVVIALSNSGETREIINDFPTLKRIGCKVISITSNPNSTMALNSDIHICIGKLKEADHLNLAPTTSSTATLVMGDAIALTLSYLKGFRSEDFALYHPGGSLGKGLTGKEM